MRPKHPRASTCITTEVPTSETTYPEQWPPSFPNTIPPSEQAFPPSLCSEGYKFCTNSQVDSSHLQKSCHISHLRKICSWFHFPDQLTSTPSCCHALRNSSKGIVSTHTPVTPAPAPSVLKTIQAGFCSFHCLEVSYVNLTKNVMELNPIFDSQSPSRKSSPLLQLGLGDKNVFIFVWRLLWLLLIFSPMPTAISQCPLSFPSLFPDLLILSGSQSQSSDISLSLWQSLLGWSHTVSWHWVPPVHHRFSFCFLGYKRLFQSPVSHN